jgi:hypothetical protein
MDTNGTEYWLNYRGYWLVSNKGRLFAQPRVVIKSVHGKACAQQYKGRILKGTKSATGYHQFELNGNTLLIHRIVAEAFIPNPKNKPHINHKDGDKLNNCVENLEWCTPSENVKHAVNNRLHAHGERVNTSKLTEKDVKEIRNLYPKKTQGYLSLVFGVTQAMISEIVNRKSWKHI